jgi:diacylglycerol O-acyltransferase / wax synthase
VERLRPQDATLWCVQAPDAPLQIGALCLFEGGPLVDDRGLLRIADLRRHVEARLVGLPRFRTRLASVAYDQGLVWVDDPSFDVAHHVRVAAVPHPGGDAELRELVSRLIEVPLDPTRPLWEIWLVEGVAGDRVAVIPKVSHVMADGMAILEFALSLLDLEPGAPVAEAVAGWSPEPPPDDRALVAAEVAARTRLVVDAVGGLARSLLRPDRVLGGIGRLAGVASSTAGLAPRLPITGPVGPHRDFAWVRLPIDDLLRVKRAHGVTLNDVVLAVVAGGLRTYLQRHDAPVDRPVRVIVPVSTHVTAGAEIENRFSMMVTGLPVGVADPVERLVVVHEEMSRRKAQAQADIGPVLFTIGGLVPPPLLRLAGPTLLTHQPFVNMAVTNLPGTREPMFLLGARMLELFPYVAVTGNIATIIGVLSYEDGLGVGVTVDADVVPDADALVADLEASARALVTA